MRDLLNLLDTIQIPMLEGVGLTNRKPGEKFKNSVDDIVTFQGVEFYPDSGAYDNASELIGASTDAIEAQGVAGTVSEIQIFVTKLVTGNNQTIFVPNGILSNGVITNFSLGKNRRANLLFNISYDTNIKTAKEIVMRVLENNPNVLKTPAPTVVVNLLTDAAIQLAIRPWSKNDDFADMCSDVLEKCKEAFDAAGILIQPSVK